MVKKFSANVSNWFKKRLGSTASNVKMNGTQSAGTSENVAREDHVHPVPVSLTSFRSYKNPPLQSYLEVFLEIILREDCIFVIQHVV